jgi:hypothetical protein
MTPVDRQCLSGIPFRERPEEKALEGGQRECPRSTANVFPAFREERDRRTSLAARASLSPALPRETSGRLRKSAGSSTAVMVAVSTTPLPED